MVRNSFLMVSACVYNIDGFPSLLRPPFSSVIWYALISNPKHTSFKSRTTLLVYTRDTIRDRQSCHRYPTQASEPGTRPCRSLLSPLGSSLLCNPCPDFTSVACPTQHSKVRPAPTHPTKLPGQAACCPAPPYHPSTTPLSSL
jgi:hypothetical protein